MLYRRLFSFLIFVQFLSSCKEESIPSTIAGEYDFLVVDGYINTGGGPSTIKLSRTAELKGSRLINTPEVSALVKVIGEDGFVITGHTTSAGICILETTNLNQSQRYRLYIKSTSGKEYQTEFLENKRTPEIDDIVYKIKDIGLQVFVNTHDPANETKYYNWTYEERLGNSALSFISPIG